MSLRPEHELQYLKSPSPASSETSMSSSNTPHWYQHSPSPHPQQPHVLPHHRSMQSLPPLRDFLRGSGLSPSLESRPTSSGTEGGARYEASLAAAHAAAREDALQRTLGRAATFRQTSAHTSSKYGPPGVMAHSRSLNRSSSDGVYRSGYADRNCSDSDGRLSSHAGKHPPYSTHSPSMSSPYPSPLSYPGLSPYSHPGRNTERFSSSRTVSMAHDKAAADMKMASYLHRSVSDSSAGGPPVQSMSAAPHKKRKLPQEFENEESDDEDEHNGSVHAGVVKQSAPEVTDVSKGLNNMDLHEHTVGSTGLKPSGPKAPKSKDPVCSPPAAPSPRGSSDELAASSDDGGPLYFTPDGIKLEVKEVEVAYDTKEWLKHVEKAPEAAGKAQWQCTWQAMKNGVPMPCDYSSKKHLVKRHIEATHLRIKRFQCTWCGKTFTQRSNVAGCHLNTHTGEAPHGCDFCGERFKDPSKRHKHMTRRHGYRARQGAKKFKADVSAQGVSAHESIAPWTVGSPSSSSSS